MITVRNNSISIFTLTNLFISPDLNIVVHLLSSPSCTLPLVPSQYAQQPCPSLGEFQSLWKTWDKVTLTMIPIMELLEQPISLRRDLIFYVGHTPTFQGKHQNLGG